jgi:hypothetical protein
MPAPKTSGIDALLGWGIGISYSLVGYVLQSVDEEDNCEVTRTLNEIGAIAGYTFHNFTKTLKVGGLIYDATVLPKPGDTMTVNGVLYYVMPPVSKARASGEKTKFTISLERAEDNNLPAAA